MQRHNFRVISSFPPRKCGIGAFSQNLTTALQHFTGEIGAINIAAIDKGRQFEGTYKIPVDLDISQEDPQSWIRNIDKSITKALERTYPTVVLLQHEFGLDGGDPKTPNFVEAAKRFSSARTMTGLITLTYLHTVEKETSKEGVDTIKKLAMFSDGIVVTTESAIEILSQAPYEIDQNKIRHIDHGVRLQNSSKYESQIAKARFGLEGILVVLTPGMQSTGKGLQFTIPAYSKLVHEHLDDESRKKIVYLIPGKVHDEFKNSESYPIYKNLIDEIIKHSDLSVVNLDSLDGLHDADFKGNDVVIVDDFPDEKELESLYAASDIGLLGYMNKQQMSSGILADFFGFGKPVISTRFAYAKELIDPNGKSVSGEIYGLNDVHARGILVRIEPTPDIEQMTVALANLTSNREKRLTMGSLAYERGHEMQESNSAYKLLRYVDFIESKSGVATDENSLELKLKSSISPQ